MDVSWGYCSQKIGDGVQGVNFIKSFNKPLRGS